MSESRPDRTNAALDLGRRAGGQAAAAFGRIRWITAQLRPRALAFSIICPPLDPEFFPHELAMLRAKARATPRLVRQLLLLPHARAAQTFLLRRRGYSAGFAWVSGLTGGGCTSLGPAPGFAG
jgi:hypothetical protein